MALPIAAAGALTGAKTLLTGIGAKLFATKLSTGLTTFFGAKLLGL